MHEKIIKQLLLKLDSNCSLKKKKTETEQKHLKW